MCTFEPTMDFDETAQENTATLLETFTAFQGDVEAFLRDENVHIPFISTNHPTPKDLSFHYDIDGAVVEVSKFFSLKSGLHYLFLANNKSFGHWPILKKHVRTQCFSQDVLTCWTHAQGVRLAYVDGGWHMNLTLVPEEAGPVCAELWADLTARTMMDDVLKYISLAFKEKLKALNPLHKDKPSIKKNNLSDLSKFAVCAGDQAFILHILDDVVDRVTLPPGLRLMRTFLQFGQKDPGPLSLVDMFHFNDHIENLTVHAATSISSKNQSVDLTWSRHAINRICGTQGNIYTNMSIHESANFQSNLNTRPMDVDRSLWQIYRPEPEGDAPHPLINFLQLYCDSPHQHQTPFYKHPVSGVIATCGVLHKASLQSMLDRSRKYLEHFGDLVDKSEIQLHARIEGVLRFEKPHVPGVVESRKTFNEEKLHHLLESTAMFLPFMAAGGQGLHTVLTAVLAHLLGTLGTLYCEAKLLGGYDNSWKAFQYELALEEFHHGQPRVSGHLPYSVSLGTNSVNIYSCTRQRGFLGLAPWSSASAGVVPPPLSCWTNIPTQRDRVERIFPVCDSLEANDVVLGREVVQVLLKDLFNRNCLIPLQQLQGEDPQVKFKVRDSLEYPELAKKVVDHITFFRYPAVFRRVHEILCQKNRDTAKVLELGLASFTLKFFPAIRYRDYKGGKKVNWTFNDFVEVRPTGAPVSEASSVAMLSEKIIEEILDRGLTGQGHVERYQEWGMPWLPLVLQRFPPEVTREDKKMNLLVFIACVAMLQNNAFMDYTRLKELHSKLPISTRRMLDLRLRSVFSLRTICRDTVLYKIADDIPTVVQVKRRRVPGKHTEKESVADDAFDDVQLLDEEETRSATSASMATPAQLNKKWTAEELALVETEGSLKDAYLHYVKGCQTLWIPYRSKKAFQRKRLFMTT